MLCWALGSGAVAEGEDEFDFAGLAAEFLGDFAGGFAEVGELVDGAIGGVFGGGGGAAFLAEAVDEVGSAHGGDGIALADLAGVAHEGFEFFDFIVGFHDQLFELAIAVVDLGGGAAGGVFDLGEEGLDLDGEFADVEGVARGQARGAFTGGEELGADGGGGGGSSGGGGRAAGLACDGEASPAADGIDDGETGAQESDLGGGHAQKCGVGQ